MSQIHQALASIVDTCEKEKKEKNNTCASSAGGDYHGPGGRPEACRGGEQRVEGSGGSSDGSSGDVREGGADEGRIELLVREDGAVIVERSRASLRVRGDGLDAVICMW